MITNLPSYKIRRWYLVNFIGYKIDATSAIHMGCFFTGRVLTVGQGSVINRNCYLDCREGIFIGKNVSVSPECYIISAGHDAQSSDFVGKNGIVRLMDYVWLGARGIVLPGIIMHTGSVAGAGAVVTKNVEEYFIVGGNPAKKINTRTHDLVYNLNWFPYFNSDID